MKATPLRLLSRLSTKFILLAAVFFNLLTWQLIIPIWHFPDEQAHFGQVAFRAEHGRVQNYRELSTSREIVISEELLKTKRDSLGNNSFTYHPEFKINYLQSFDGPNEAEIESLNNPNDRKTEILEESTRYPLLYYYLTSKIYNLFDDGDLFARVYAVRFFSILIFIFTVLTILATSKLIFPKNFFSQISLTSIIVFMPMFVFSSSGVTSDGLFNFLFMLSMYLLARITFAKSGWKEMILLVIVIIAGIATKFQFQIIWLIIAFALFVVFWQLKFKKKLIFVGGLIIFLPITLVIINFLRFFVNDYGNPTFTQLLRLPIIPETEDAPLSFDITFRNHFINTAYRTIREVLPWYFGVYKWLSLTLPPIVYKIINRTLLLSIIGLVIFAFKIVRQRKLDQQAKMLVFLAYSAFSYFIAITIFDWFFIRDHGFSFGIQGRYFYPTIIAHISLVFAGLIVLFPEPFKKWAAAILVIATIVFNYFSLFWVASHYYDLSSFNTFITQASQYKPEIFKGFGIVLILFLSIISMTLFLCELKLSNIVHRSKISIK